MVSSLQRISSIFFVVETKRFDSSFVNVILTRQTCDHRSSRVAGSKRRALAFYFSAKNAAAQCQLPTILQPNTFVNQKLAQCGLILFTRTKSCTHLDPTFLHILILRTYTKFVRKNKMLAHGVCFPQPCSSDGRRVAASRSRLDHYIKIGSFPQE